MTLLEERPEDLESRLAAEPVTVDPTTGDAAATNADEISAPQLEDWEVEPPVPPLRAGLVVGTTVTAAGIVVGTLFEGLQGHVLPAVAGLGGVLVAAQASRRKRVLAVNLTIALGIIGTGLVLVALGGTGELFRIVNALRDARSARSVLRPPVEFLAGFRAITGWLMAGVGFAAGWLAIELRRPAMGLLSPLPVMIIAAISVPAAAKLPVGVGVLVLFIIGLALLSSLTDASATGVEGEAPPLSYELRRAAKAIPVVVVLVLVIVVLSRSGLLFPPPVYDPVRDAQRPKAIPLSQVEDKILFEVRSKSTGPWRIGLLDVYDGTEWRLPAFAESELKRVPRSGVVDPDVGPATRADFLVKELGGAVLPGLPSTASIVATGPKLAYDPRTGAIRLAEGQIKSGLEYTVTGGAVPTEEQLNALTGGVPARLDRFLDAPSPPPAVQALLAEAPASPAWARLDFVRRSLLETVTASGPGLPVPVPPAKVDDMLNGSKEGSPFEIVAGQALLARWAGVPARIGYGFDGGEVLSENVREIHPKHGSSWLEVWFPQFGWFPVLGAPLKAKASLSAEDPTNTNPQVVQSDEIAVQVFIPLRSPVRSLFFDQVRRIVFLLLPIVTLVALVWLLWPAFLKWRRRARRRAWARELGGVARIEVAYAELRDWCTDLGLRGEHATPLGFLSWFADDEEHTELAWLVTRTVYGDLRDRVTEDDVLAAEELSRALRKRVASPIPLTIRLIAYVSRLSVRDPWAADVRAPSRKERRDSLAA